MRNILSLFFVFILCLTLVACSAEDNGQSNNADNSPKIVESLTTSLGKEPKIPLETGEEFVISFKVNTEGTLNEASFTPVVINTEIISAEYYGSSDKYAYFKVTALSEGTTEMYVELTGKSVRSENVKFTVTNDAPDYIVGSYGSTTISIIEGRKKEISFAVLGYDLSPEKVEIVVANDKVAKAEYLRVDGQYVYFKIEALSGGKTEIYLQTADGAVKSDSITVSVVPKGTLPEEEETLVGFIANKSSMKFHLPTCGLVDSISEENKEFYEVERETLIDAGYQPCKNCNP